MYDDILNVDPPVIEIDIETEAPDGEIVVEIDEPSDSLPSGGSPGQVLTRTENGAEWLDPVAGSITINGEKPDKNGNFIINTLNDVQIAELSALII